MSRRGLLGLAALAACSSYAPPPKLADGTVRTQDPYGASARQHGEWWVPDVEGPLPTVVLVHGGYWRADYDLTLEDAVAADLAARGFLVWNVDYAPSSAPWPSTLTDVAAAYDHLTRGAHADRVDRSRVAVVGHSAGGHLALWLASRGNLPAGAPGEGDFLRPALAVPQAPVASLASAVRLGLGSGAANALLQGQEHLPVADPVALVPSGVRTVIVHGVDDDVVPISQSEEYLAADPTADLVRVPGGHFEHLDPGSEACEELRKALATL